MRVLIIADTLFALREQTLLTRLEVGLADEGLRVVQALPLSAMRTQEVGVFARSVPYIPRTFPPARTLALRSLIRRIEGDKQSDDAEPISVVHAFGGECWKLARDLAVALRAGLLLSVWRHGLCAPAGELCTKAESRHALRAACALPDALYEKELRRVAPKARGIILPWGILTPDEKPARTPGTPASIMLIGTGRDADAFEAALTGLAASIKAGTDALIFCDAHAARRADLWPVARALGLLDRLSLVEDLEAQRNVVLCADLLLYPEAAGEQRSLLLEAMGAGVPILAARDPLVSVLVEGRTAHLVERTSAAQWQQGVTRILSDDAHVAATCRSARAFVQEHRRATAYIQAVIHAYDQLTSTPASV